MSGRGGSPATASALKDVALSGETTIAAAKSLAAGGRLLRTLRLATAGRGRPKVVQDQGCPSVA